MSVWRPSNNCTYVVSDINGMHSELELILSRILPLRKTGGHLDKLIFLGNYSVGSRSAETLDILIKANIDSPDQIISLCGDKDLQLIKSMDSSPEDYKLWLDSGGHLALSGYQKRLGIDSNPYLIRREYLSRFIPQEHLQFIKSLMVYYETDNYICVHGGCDPNIPLFKQSRDVLVNDRSVFKLCSKDRFKCPWNKTIITGGIGKLDGQPLIRDKFITLDGSYAERLYVMELNSCSVFSARKGKSRLVKESIT